MKDQSVGVKILLWSEIIISIRVLLFAIPVMINKYSAKQFTLLNLDDRFIAVITLTALLYLFVGILSLVGFKIWKVMHYLAAICILLLTVRLLNVENQPTESLGIHYFFPVLFSVVVAVCAGFLSNKRKLA